MRTIIALIGTSLLASAAGADALRVQGMQVFDNTQYHHVPAGNIDQNYHVFVGLPDSYAESADREYPTVYLLDGGVNFPLLVSYQRQLLLTDRAPDVILVGISYGTDNFEEGNGRSRDYTAETSEREYWGGAGDFQEFLGAELIPMIESSYRSRPDRRILFGQSLGGQFVLYSAQTRPDLFWGHIAVNPALHRNLPFFLEQHSTGETRTQLFVGSTSNETPRFKGPAKKWIEHWTSQEKTPWRLKVVVLDGHTHLSANPATYRQGIKWLFSTNK